MATTGFAIAPPVEPMLAKLSTVLPVGDGFGIGVVRRTA